MDDGFCSAKSPPNCFLEHECNQSGWFVLIVLMPPLLHTQERQFVRRACMDELRNVMHERGDLSRFLISSEVGLSPLILPERMQLGNKEAAAITENAECLREDE